MVVQGGNNNMIVQGCPITQVMDKRDPCGPGNSPAVWLIHNEVQLLYFLLSPQILLCLRVGLGKVTRLSMSRGTGV